MFTYSQSTGQLKNAEYEDEILGVGYSGNGAGKNNPAMQNVKDVGPIPQGLYVFGEPTTEKGPLTIPLEPDLESGQNMFGRSGFLIHGDSLEHPGEASEGCIVLGPEVRDMIATAGDFVLKVIP